MKYRLKKPGVNAIIKDYFDERKQIDQNELE